MSERDEKSMEQHAREHAEEMEREVGLYAQLSDANDSDDIDSDTWVEIEAWLDTPIECDNCGEAPSSHVTDDDGNFNCTGAEADGDSFSIRDLDSLRDDCREQIDSWNYGAGVDFTVNVTMYGGGPAGGIEFECGRTRHGLEMYSGRVWHQDWFQPKGWASLDDDTASRLWDTWGLEYLMEGEG